MTFKRFLALLLVLCTLGSLVTPAAAQAAEDPQTTLDSSNMAFIGTNSFGNLLAAEISTHQLQEETAEAGFSVTDLSFSGSTATVTYSALREAILVVAVYTEDGLQLLCSGKTIVFPDETTAKVTVQGNMPEYFYAGAYLLDATDYVPLCEEYTTPMYTREMRELLASTVDSYDPEKVYNLDDDRTTNFAVFAEDTIVIDEQPGVNTVASVDDTNKVYVIENADETITSLQPGDVLAYPYGDGDILIVKVASLSVSGTTATISGTDMEIDEAFSHVKIQAVTSELQADPNVSAEGITRRTVDCQPLDWDSGVEIGQSFTYQFDLLGRDLSSNSSVKVTGSLTIGITASVTVYSTQSYTQVTTKLDFAQNYTVTAEGKCSLTMLDSFAEFTMTPFAGVSVSVAPKLILEFSGALATNYAYTASVGSSLTYDGTKWVAREIRENPAPDYDLKLEGTVFLGISVTPSVELLKGKLARIGLECKLGVEIKGTYSLVDTGHDPSVLHECQLCIDGDVSFVCSLEVSVTCLDNPKLSAKAKLVDIKFKFLDYYWCQDRNEFHLGTCPYISYLVTLGVFDQTYQPVADARVTLSDGTVLVTNSGGLAEAYLPNGRYTATAEDVTTRFTVADRSQKVLIAAFLQEPESGLPGDVTSETITDFGPVVDYGNCGDSLFWFLKADGTLVLSGTGEMPRYSTSNQPWYSYKDSITAVQVMDGVMSIGRNAFYRYGKLASVSLASTVETIGHSAFYACSNLAEMYIPASITKIESEAFRGCAGLQQFRVDGQNLHYSSDDFGVLFDKEKTTLIQAPAAITGNYTVPEGASAISAHAFRECKNLTGITMPDSVTFVGEYAFYDCSSLSGAVLSNNLTEISRAVFLGCEALSQISIPSGVTSIGDHGFFGCKSLTELILPERLTTIGSNAFCLCNRLVSINFPGSLVSIGEQAFYSCAALKSVLLPEGLTSIGDWAFYDCDAITDFYLPSTLTSIGESAFSGSDGIKSVSIPENLTVIENGAFSFCYYLASLTIPKGVTTIGDTAFKWDLRLTSVTFPESVTLIGSEAFYNCKSLKKITFQGDVPQIHGTSTFYEVTATVYYPGDNPTWTSDMMRNYGGKLTWVPYTLDESGNMVINEAAAMTVTPSGEAIPEEALTVNAAEEVPSPTVEDVIPEEAPVLNTSFTDDLVIEEKPEEDVSPDAIFGGDYSSEVIDNSYILKTASFTGLVPGEEYVMLALVSTEAADILAANNLLAILQGTAASDGTLQFRYVQRVNTDISYVVACGASNKNLADATITFPEMKANESLQAVDPTVVYNGVTLTEGVDYEITGTVSFTDPGTYTCTIRGIHNYTGAVECTYTVEDGTLPGDVNGDEKADSIDACLIVLYYREQLELTEDQLRVADMDGNGIVDLADAYAILLTAN